jgi:hypothetical protein
MLIRLYRAAVLTIRHGTAFERWASAIIDSDPPPARPAGDGAGAVRAADLLARYQNGELAVILTVHRQRQLLMYVLASQNGRGVAGDSSLVLDLLTSTDDRRLRRLFDDGGELLRALTEKIRPDQKLRGELERFRARLAALAQGGADAMREPQPFALSQLNPALRGLGVSEALGDRQLLRIIDDLSGMDVQEPLQKLARLEGVERTRAMVWLRTAISEISARPAVGEAGKRGNVIGFLNGLLSGLGEPPPARDHGRGQGIRDE